MGLESSTTRGDDPSGSWAFTRLAPHKKWAQSASALLLMDVGSPVV